MHIPPRQLTSALAFGALLATGGIAHAQSGDPVPQPAPNAPSQQPAFERQTRAPQRQSDIRLEVEQVTGGLEHPWAMEFLPDGRMLVTERPGRLRIVTRTGSSPSPSRACPRSTRAARAGCSTWRSARTSRRTARSTGATPSRARAATNGTAVARGRLGED